MEKVNIHIDSLCSESWDNMLPVKDGRYCDHCKKEVVDFTSMSDPEIVAFFRRNSGPICGRLRESQSHRDIVQNENRRGFDLSLRSLISAMLLISPISGATNTHPIGIYQTQEEIRNPESPEIYGDSSYILRGKVIDRNGEPVPNTFIIVDGLKKALTDFDGMFQVTLDLYQYSDTINFTFANETQGYIAVNMAFDKHLIPSYIEVIFESSQIDITMVGGISSTPNRSLKRFFRRAFHRKRYL